MGLTLRIREYRRVWRGTSHGQGTERSVAVDECAFYSI